MYNLDSTFYNMSQVDTYVDRIMDSEISVCNKGNTHYLNIPCSFDIEASSFYQKKEKHACMYVWAFGINGIDIYGRTWDEYINLITFLHLKLELNANFKLVCYVHNLSYEWQWFKSLHTWDKVFAMSERRLLYCSSNIGIEYRCSYMLTGKSLENVGKDLLYPLPKLIGNVDYTLIRTPYSRLTQSDLDYSKRDVDIVQCLIWDKLSQGENIANIPLTKTGYTRKLFKQECLTVPPRVGRIKRLPNNKFRNLIKNLWMEMGEYASANRAFIGGFTHASCFYVDKLLTNCGGFDFTSSYPATVADFFPMSKGVLKYTVSKTEYIELIKYYFVIADFTFYNVDEKILNEHYISVSKCGKGSIIGSKDNGRVVNAERIIITLTDIDYDIFNKFYIHDIDKMEIKNVWIYEKAYLPKEFIITWLNLYESKTKLKGVEGEELNYQLNKENCNAGYGMAVTNPLRENYNFDGNILKAEIPDYIEALQKYNNSRNRFLFYLWGVYITAHARRNLIYGMFLPFSGLDNDGNTINGKNCNYIYSDTDSNKVRNPNECFPYVEKYNLDYTNKINKMLDYYGIDKSKVNPKDIKGNVHPLGHIDFEGEYVYFKALGAKRYMYVDREKYNLHLTVAGVPKKRGLQAILNRAINNTPLIDANLDNVYINAFNLFKTGLNLSPSEINKICLTYVDEPCSGYVKDYNGDLCYYEEQTYVHAEQIGFEFKRNEEFIKYLGFLKGESDIEVL